MRASDSDALGRRVSASAKAAEETANIAALIAADARLDALADNLEGFVAWAEEYREQCRRAGERPAIDAHRVNRAKAALKRVGR